MELWITLQSHRPKRKNQKRRRNESVAMMPNLHHPTSMVAAVESTAVARRRIERTKS
jgi:hypothetical protein